MGNYYDLTSFSNQKERAQESPWLRHFLFLRASSRCFRVFFSLATHSLSK
jgi:hypothetical protein